MAAGVRGLAAAVPEPAPPGRPQPARPRILAGPRRRAILAASVAAALVILAGVGYGAITVHAGHAPGTVLTAVSGCAGAELASGTLQQVNGSRLVVKTASGQPLTVTTTPSTRVSVAGPLLGGITDGASVIAAGPASGGTIAAATVTIASSLTGLTVTPPPGWAAAGGTVADASTTGFTVVTSAGARVPVATSGDTFVVVRNAGLGQLQAGAATGATIVAVGRAGPGGTLSAVGVLQQRAVQQPSGAQVQVQLGMKAHDCSPASLADALTRVLVPGS